VPTHGRRTGGRRHNGDVTDLIDTTEMYLRTIFELEEEGVVPLRARIAERLNQTGPTVSQTVARMQRDGLVSVEGDRHLQLSPHGRTLAMRVMRKHRLAECLLVDVIGLQWEQVHEEACRWEHVMSEAVERRILEMLGHPTHSPYGNPIPGLQELGEAAEALSAGTLQHVTAVASERASTWLVRRIGEPAQGDVGVLATLGDAGIRPGARVLVQRSGSSVSLTADSAEGAGTPVHIALETATHIFVSNV
jgi:DtxR family Mn-dependent transcriptional regulator